MRVNEMMIAPSLGDKEVLIVSRRREHLIRQRQHHQEIGAVLAARIADADLPRIPCLIHAHSKNRTGTEIRQCIFDPGILPAVRDAVQRKPLDERAAVNLHTRLPQTRFIYCAAILLRRAQLELRIADTVACRCDLFGRRRLFLCPRTLPQLCQRARRHVERAVRAARDLLRERQRLIERG